ncbi:MAG: SRPBCC domain-containing protein [Pseudomonadota bacterium]|nr:SRPBCC domain-containing protein [Pseudomonadota bacterium]
MSALVGAGVRVRAVVKASIHEVWQAFTTRAGTQSFFAPKTRIDLALGGPYEIYFNPANDAQSTKGKRVLSYEPETMLSFEWSAPPEVPAVRHGNTWVVVRLMSRAPGETEVNICHLGYGRGPEWGKARKHFEQGWADLLERLQQRFAVGPIDWACQPMMWKEPGAIR